MPNRSQEHLIRVGRAGPPPAPPSNTGISISLAPPSMQTNTGIKTLTVTGNRPYAPNSQVYVDGVAQATTQVAADKVSINYQTNGVSVGTKVISVVDPATFDETNVAYFGVTA